MACPVWLLYIYRLGSNRNELISIRTEPKLNRYNRTFRFRFVKWWNSKSSCNRKYTTQHTHIYVHACTVFNCTILNYTAVICSAQVHCTCSAFCPLGVGWSAAGGLGTKATQGFGNIHISQPHTGHQC